MRGLGRDIILKLLCEICWDYFLMLAQGRETEFEFVRLISW